MFELKKRLDEVKISEKEELEPKHREKRVNSVFYCVSLASSGKHVIRLFLTYSII